MLSTWGDGRAKAVDGTAVGDSDGDSDGGFDGIIVGKGIDGVTVGMNVGDRVLIMLKIGLLYTIDSWRLQILSLL